MELTTGNILLGMYVIQWAVCEKFVKTSICVHPKSQKYRRKYKQRL